MAGEEAAAAAAAGAPTTSVSTLVLVVALVCALHIAAFGFWVYKYATTSDKRVMDLKQSKD